MLTIKWERKPKIRIVVTSLKIMRTKWGAIPIDQKGTSSKRYGKTPEFKKIQDKKVKKNP